jgi:hypothetical protein
MSTFFDVRAVTWVLSAMATFTLAPAHSADRLYHFVDEQGVPHFSNVPADPRYRPLPRTGNSAAPQPGLASPPGVPAVPQEVPLAAGLGLPAAQSANGFAEPTKVEIPPEDMVPAEMFTDDSLAPGVEVEPQDR